MAPPLSACLARPQQELTTCEPLIDNLPVHENSAAGPRDSGEQTEKEPAPHCGFLHIVAEVLYQGSDREVTSCSFT